MDVSHHFITSKQYRDSIIHAFLMIGFVMGLWLCHPWVGRAKEEMAHIPDNVLRISLLKILNKPSNGEITVNELASLERVVLTGFPDSEEDEEEYYRIRYLTGLEHATHLQSLIVGTREGVTNLAPIQALTRLTELRIPSNAILDLTPVASLTNLTVLDIGRNTFGGHLDPLAGLTHLTELSMERNSIRDISPIGGLTNLVRLDLDQNMISEIDPLTNLTRLVELDLDRNQISLLTALSRLTNLVSLDLAENLVTNLAPLARMIKLQDLDLLRNQASDVTPLSGLSALTNLVLAGNLLTEITALSSLIRLTTLDLRGNQMELTSGSANQLTLQAFISQGTTVESVPQFIDSPDNLIPDSRLRTLVQFTTGTGYETILTPGHLAAIRYLDADQSPEFLDPKRIHNLTGLQYVTNLTSFTIKESGISDLGPLAGMTQLLSLHMAKGKVANLAPLSNLTNLVNLFIQDNAITNLAALSSLSNLVWVDLDHNRIEDISPLAGLIQLNSLDLADNQILDLSPLAGLHSLRQLDLDENRIVDISVMQYLTNLVVLDLHSNRLIDVKPLESLNQLLWLRVDQNYLNLAPGSVSQTTLDSMRSGGCTVHDSFQRQFELRIVRQDGEALLSWAGIRGLHFKVRTGHSPFDWTIAESETFSGEDSELTYKIPAMKTNLFFRLGVTLTP